MTGSEFTAAALLGILQDEATRIAARLGLPLVVELGLRAEADRDAVTVTFYVPRAVRE